MANKDTAINSPETEGDPWDVFLGDDDLEPEPQPGDFSFEDDELPFTGMSTEVLFAAL